MSILNTTKQKKYKKNQERHFYKNLSVILNIIQNLEAKDKQIVKFHNIHIKENTYRKVKTPKIWTQRPNWEILIII